jgi:hypothetical protein
MSDHEAKATERKTYCYRRSMTLSGPSISTLRQSKLSALDSDHFTERAPLYSSTSIGISKAFGFPVWRWFLIGKGWCYLVDIQALGLGVTGSLMAPSNPRAERRAL